jgi:hypothetical protein
MKSTGKRGNYFWVEWRDDFLGDLLSAFPQIVLGKYLVNTSFDSGSLSLVQEEIEQGWRKHKELTLSPPIKEVSLIPKDQYDEWYVFSSPTTFENYEVFVNYGGFSLQDFLVEIQERFWQQLERLAPESFLSEGEHLICVTRNESLFNQVSLWEGKAH